MSRKDARSGERGPRQSSVIRRFEYDEASRRLSITFVSGKTYVYDKVPQDVFEAFAAAPSRGKFYNEHIRDQYDYALAA